MNLINNPKAVELLERAATRSDRETGLRIAYFEGDYSSEVARTKIGKAAWSLYERGLVRLYQKKLQDEPRLYSYIAEVI